MAKIIPSNPMDPSTATQTVKQVRMQRCFFASGSPEGTMSAPGKGAVGAGTGEGVETFGLFSGLFLHLG